MTLNITISAHLTESFNKVKTVLEDFTNMGSELNNLRINVFHYDDEDEKIYTLNISDNTQLEATNLLLISNEHQNTRYCLIKNF